MKSSIVTPVGTNSEVYMAAKLFQNVAFMQTLAGLSIAVFKKQSDPFVAVILANKSTGKSKIHFLPASDAAYNNISRSTPICVVHGEKTDKGMQFGVGTLTPQAVDNAIVAALDTLNTQNQIDTDLHNVFGLSVMNELGDRLREIVLPDVGDISPRRGLDQVLDLLIPIIRGCDGSLLPAAIVKQNSDLTATIELFMTNPLGEPEQYLTGAVAVFELNSPSDSTNGNAVSPRLAFD